MSDETLAPIAKSYVFAAPGLFEGDPLDSRDQYDSLAIHVVWRGGATWTVSRGDGWSPQLVWCEKRGEWEYEPQPSSRTDAFRRRTRYTLDRALAIGARLAAVPSVSDEGEQP